MPKLPSLARETQAANLGYEHWSRSTPRLIRAEAFFAHTAKGRNT